MDKKQKKIRESLNSYAKYSAIAFQMMAVLLAGVFGGITLDKRISIDFPVFTVVLSLLAIGLALYIVLKDLSR